MSEFKLWNGTKGSGMSYPDYLKHLHKNQWEFMQAKERNVAIGGGRGGGATYALIAKALLLADTYPGIRILMLAGTYWDAKERLYYPIECSPDVISEKDTESNKITFTNTSAFWFDCKVPDFPRLRSYNVVMVDRAEDFNSYDLDRIMIARYSNIPIPPRVFMTIHPTGIGAKWLKSHFVTKQVPYDASYNPEDYRYISVTAGADNPYLSEEYRKELDNLPTDIISEWRDGVWRTNYDMWEENNV